MTARRAFKALGNYKDSAAKVQEMETALAEQVRKETAAKEAARRAEEEAAREAKRLKVELLYQCRAARPSL